DTGYQDPGYQDTGYHDTGFPDLGSDPGYHDTGYQDSGYHDAGYRQPGVDTAFHQLDPALQQLDPNFPPAGVGHDEARPPAQVSTPTTGPHLPVICVREHARGAQSLGCLLECRVWPL